MKTIRLREGKERSLLCRHPWVFDGAIERGRADPGETVRVEAADGRFLAWGAFSPVSRIRVRCWNFDEAERSDATMSLGVAVIQAYDLLIAWHGRRTEPRPTSADTRGC